MMIQYLKSYIRILTHDECFYHVLNVLKRIFFHVFMFSMYEIFSGNV